MELLVEVYGVVILFLLISVGILALTLVAYLFLSFHFNRLIQSDNLQAKYYKSIEEQFAWKTNAMEIESLDHPPLPPTDIDPERAANPQPFVPIKRVKKHDE